MPTSNTRHQLNSQKVRQSENGCRLTMGVCMHAMGLYIGEVLKQSIKNVRCLIGSARDKAAEQRNVDVRNVSVSDATGLAITNVMLGKKIVFVRFEMGAVSGCGLPRPPLLRQLKLSIQVDQIRRGRTQVCDVDMATIGKSQLISRNSSTEMPRSFRWPKSAAVGKCGQHVALAGVFNLGTKPGWEPEVPAPLCPVFCV